MHTKLWGLKVRCTGRSMDWMSLICGCGIELLVTNKYNVDIDQALLRMTLTRTSKIFLIRLVLHKIMICHTKEGTKRNINMKRLNQLTV